MVPLVSPETRLDAAEWNTVRPSAVSPGKSLAPFAWPPPESTLTRTMIPVARWRRNTSATAFVSPATKLEARERNATKVPLALTAGTPLNPLPSAPDASALMISVVPLKLSRRNTSSVAFVSPGTMLVAWDRKAMIWPSSLTEGS